MGNKSKRGNAQRADLRGVKAFTAKQIKLIDEYMVDRNAKQAALRAGYCESFACGEVHRIINTPAFVMEIERREKARAERVDVQSDDIIRELKRIAFFDVRRLIDEHGRPKQRLTDLTEDEARGLVNFDIVVLDRDGNYIVKHNPGNKLKALELLGKIKKLFSESVDVNLKAQITHVEDFGDNDDEAE